MGQPNKLWDNLNYIMCSFYPFNQLILAAIVLNMEKMAMIARRKRRKYG